MALYPINLNIAGQLCVVIGGGAVAARKIQALIPCAARIRIISPEISPGVEELINQHTLEWIPREYMTGDLQGAGLVFALTNNPKVQQQVAADAGNLAIPINIADNPEACTFQTAATIRQGDLLISISTGGGSPSLSATIRKELEGIYGPEYGDFIKLLAEIRRLTMTADWPPDTPKILYEKMLHANILPLLKNKDWPKLQKKLQEVLPQKIDTNQIVRHIREY